MKMFTKAKCAGEKIKEHYPEALAIAFIGVSLLALNDAYNRGYKCRKDLERFADNELDTNIVETLDKFCKH